MIYVNGDSWSQKKFNDLGLEYTWPHLLQKKLGITVLNESAGCGSNSRCLNNLLKIYQSGTKLSVIIIGLSTFQRWHLPSRLASSWSIGPTVINDRFNQANEQILSWWRKNVYDEVEFVYQYYNHIWQMHELAVTGFKCPILFFNAWDTHIIDIHRKIFEQDNVEVWMQEKTGQTTDYALTNYQRCFDFFKTQLPKWLFFIKEPWANFLQNHIDGPEGLHPAHPSPEGHMLICDFVCSKMKQLNINLNNNIDLQK